MSNQTPQVRAIATQLIRHAIKQIDAETACDHIVATLGEDVDVDALAFGSESAVRKARIDISWDGAPAAPPLSPVVQSPVREQLLNAIDFSYCQTLGYATPEGLLAAYEASRTQTVDQAALVRACASFVRDTYSGEWADDAAATLETDADKVERGEPCSLLRLAAVLPATTNHDTDRRAVLVEAADRAEIVALRLRLKHDYGAANGAYEVMEDLRRLAAECPECGTTGACNGGPCPLRRVADETAATETAHQPRRGDQVEAWLKAQRDDHRDADRGQWTVLDNLLDRYRLHADTGTPLGEHVCEARVVGDCECLEQPAAGARQDGAQR